MGFWNTIILPAAAAALFTVLAAIYLKRRQDQDERPSRKEFDVVVARVDRVEGKQQQHEISLATTGQAVDGLRADMHATKENTSRMSADLIEMKTWLKMLVEKEKE